MTAKKNDSASKHDRIRVLTTTILESSPLKPFAFEQHYHELYSILPPNPDVDDLLSKEVSALNLIGATVKKHVTTNVATQLEQARDVTALVKCLERLFCSLQRLNSVCTRLLRRVDWGTYIQGKRYQDDSITQIAFDALVKSALRRSSKTFISAAKSDFDRLLSKHYEQTPRLELSKYFQYLYCLDQYLKLQPTDETSFTQKLCLKPLLNCVTEFGRVQAAKLRMSSPSSKSKSELANSCAFLESIHSLWHTKVRSQLYIAFLQSIDPNEHSYCLPFIHFGVRDRQQLCEYRDRLCTRAYEIYVEQCLGKHKPMLINLIGSQFADSIKQPQKLRSNSNSANSLISCYQAVKHLYNLMPSREQKLTLMGVIFTDLAASYEKVHQQQKKKTTTTTPKDNTKAADEYLVSVEHLSNCEHILHILVHSYLYNNPDVMALGAKQFARFKPSGRALSM